MRGAALIDIEGLFRKNASVFFEGSCRGRKIVQNMRLLGEHVPYIREHFLLIIVGNSKSHSEYRLGAKRPKQAM